MRCRRVEHRRKLFIQCFCSLLLAFFLLTTAAVSEPFSRTTNHRPGSSYKGFAAIDGIMNEAVDQGRIPGAVVIVGHNGKVVYRKAFGWRSLEPTKERMTVDTVFDLASLTKCVATATSVMKLLEEGRVRLNDPVTSYLPEFGQNGKQDVTVRELLTHYSGLRPDLDLQTPWQGRDTAYQMLMQEKPAYSPGSRFLYSDINFETLGFIVERVSGASLSDFARKNIFAPLKMKHTSI